MKLIEDKDKLTQITEDSLKNIMEKSDRTSLELVKYFQIEKIKIKNQQEGRFIPSGKVYIIQKGSDLVLAPRPIVYKHCNPWRIFNVDSKNLSKEQLFTLEILTMQISNIKEIRKKLQKYFLAREEILLRKIKKRRLDWCEEYKLNRILLLNYTERGKIRKLLLIFILLQYFNVLQLLYFNLLSMVYIIFFLVYVHTNNFLLLSLINLFTTILFYHVQYECTNTIV